MSDEKSPLRAGPRVSFALVGFAWLATAALGFGPLGGWLAQLIEGMDQSHVSTAPVVLVACAGLMALALTVLWARALGESGPDAGEQSSGLARRRFLAGLGAAGGGLVATGAAALVRNIGWVTVTGPAIPVDTPTEAESPRSEWQGARVRQYRPLGRTGFEVSDISLGSSRIKGELGEQVARSAIERGINYFDTAPDYSEAGSELALGRAMQGRREQMFLATKFCTPKGNLPAGSAVETYVAAVEESLARLRTDYVDLVHIHSCDTLERLLDPNVHEAFDRLKAQGKARFLGFSSHTPNLVAVADAAIESGRFDVMMLAYHHGAWPRLGDVIDRAHAADMGVVAMKTLKGAKHEGLLESRDAQDAYTQAAFKWVLANPKVSCLVISFSKLAHLDEYLFASGRQPGPADHAALRDYDRRIAGIHCYPHCGECLGTCPESVPIHDVLRHRMYFEDYGDEREAMRGYAQLPIRADACASCAAPCAGACPHGVDIPTRTREAHAMLSLAGG